MDEDVENGQMSVLDQIFSPHFGQIECKPRCTSFINYFGIPISDIHNKQIAPIISVTNKCDARGRNPMVYITNEEKETGFSSFELSKLNFEDVLSICRTGKSGSHCVNVANLVKSKETLSIDQNTTVKRQEDEQGTCEDEYFLESSKFEFHLPEILEVKTISDLSFENLEDTICLREETTVNSIDRKVKTKKTDSGDSKITSPIHLKTVADTPCKTSFIENSPIRTQLFKTQLGLDGGRDAVTREIHRFLSGNVENKTSGARSVEENSCENSVSDSVKRVSLEELNITTGINSEVCIDTDCVANEVTSGDKNGDETMKNLLSPDSAYGTDISENPCLEDVCEQIMKSKADSPKIKSHLDHHKAKEHTKNINKAGYAKITDEAKYDRKDKPHTTKIDNNKPEQPKQNHVSVITDSSSSLGSKGKGKKSINKNWISPMCRQEHANESNTDVLTKGTQNNKSRSEKSFQTVQLKSPRVVLERIDKHYNQHKVGDTKSSTLSKDGNIQMNVDLNIGIGMNRVNRRKRKFLFDSDSESETENIKASEQLENDDCRNGTGERKMDVDVERRVFKRIKVCNDIDVNDKDVDNRVNKNMIRSQDIGNAVKIDKFKRIKQTKRSHPVPVLGEGAIQEVQTLSCAEKKTNRKVMKWLEDHTETNKVQNLQPVKKSPLSAFKIPKRKRTLEKTKDRKSEELLEKLMQSDSCSENQDISLNENANSHKRTSSAIEEHATSKENNLTKYDKHAGFKLDCEEPNKSKGDKFILTDVKKKTQNVDHFPVIGDQTQAFHPRQVDTDVVLSKKQPKSKEKTGDKECDLENTVKDANSICKIEMQLPKNAIDPFKTCDGEVKGTKGQESKETSVKECAIDKIVTQDADFTRKNEVQCEKNASGPWKDVNKVLSADNGESKSKLDKECLNTETVKLAADSICKREMLSEQKNKHAKEVHQCEQRNKHVKGVHQCEQENKHVKGEVHQCEHRNKHVKEQKCEQRNKHVKEEQKFEQTNKHVQEEQKFKQRNKHVKKEVHQYEQKNKHVKEEHRYDKISKDTRKSKSRMYKCDICKNSFFSERYLLMKHTFQKHGVQISNMRKFLKERKISFNPTKRQSKLQIYRCDICENSFFTEECLLIKHRTVKHCVENSNTRKILKEIEQCFDQPDKTKDKKEPAISKFQVNCEQVDVSDNTDNTVSMGVYRKEMNTTSGKGCCIENVDPRCTTVKHEQDVVMHTNITHYFEDLKHKNKDFINTLGLENVSANKSNNNDDFSPARKRRITHVENIKIPDINVKSSLARLTERCKVCFKVFFCESIRRHMSIAHSEEVVESNGLSILESNQNRIDVCEKTVSNIIKKDSQQNKPDNVRKCDSLTIDPVIQRSPPNQCDTSTKSSTGDEHIMNSIQSPASAGSINLLSQKVIGPTLLKSPTNELPTCKETGKSGTPLSQNKQVDLRNNRRDELKRGEYFHWKCKRCLKKFSNKAVLKEHLKSTGHSLPRNKPNL